MAFASIADLKSAIRAAEPHDFVSHYLFEPIPHAFGGDLALWVSWKRKLARFLEVDPHEMVLTGSAAVGYSLNPKKDYRPFSERSDIDVGVVSAYHFEVAWRHLRQTRPRWLALPREIQNPLRWHRQNYVFEGAIATDMILSLLPFGTIWQGGLDVMGREHPTSGRDVKLRIYRDYEALRAYQVRGVERLRQELLGAADDEVVITSVDEEDP